MTSTEALARLRYMADVLTAQAGVVPAGSTEWLVIVRQIADVRREIEHLSK